MGYDLSFDPSIPMETAETETDEIVYRISHDLRGSVRALQELPTWIVEDLQKAAIKLPPESNRHLELVASHACRLDLMLTGLLAYSRVGRMQAIGAVTPRLTLDEVIDDMSFGLEVKIENRLDRGKCQMGETDLQSIFSILITNAIRFHPTNSPHIVVSGGPVSEKMWHIDVTDDGEGIPEDKREFVLKPMTKLVSRDIDPGAGMGLAILRKIAWSYRGEVAVLRPKSHTGTTVRVKLTVN
ncbi:MAG: HAMP domain-containing histidine kinase [Silicimonas sp.]|nr:HAMP domain-containing histidine kinase [Silicimonas sp.]